MTRKMQVAGLGLMVAVLAGFATTAQAADVRAEVPFSFTVSGKTLPPGTYTLNTQGSGGLLVRSQGKGAVALTIALSNSRERGAKLVFHKYGEEYVLRQIWTGYGSGREIPVGRHERQLMQAARQGKAVASVERVVITGF
jgi:hypothetical protein